MTQPVRVEQLLNDSLTYYYKLQKPQIIKHYQHPTPYLSLSQNPPFFQPQKSIFVYDDILILSSPFYMLAIINAQQIQAEGVRVIRPR